MKTRGIHHIALKTCRVEQVATFYREVLQLPEMRRNHDAAGLRSIWFEASAAILMIERSESGSDAAPRPFFDDPVGIHLVAFAIDATDRDLWQQHLELCGYPLMHRTPHTLYVRDPDGNRVALSSRPID